MTAGLRYGTFNDADVYWEALPGDQWRRWIRMEALRNSKRRFLTFTVQEMIDAMQAENSGRHVRFFFWQEDELWVRAR